MAFLVEIWEFLVALFYGLLASLQKKTIPNLEGVNTLILPGWGAGTYFYHKLRNALLIGGFQPEILRVPPFASEKEYLNILNQTLQSCPPGIICIAHNIGGLVVGALPDSSRRKINTLITLGTPYKGYKIMGIFSHKGHEPGSTILENRLTTYLFINQFYPLSPIREYLFFPKEENLLYGQGRDQWFDIPGNYNLVRRKENLRTLIEFLSSIHPEKSHTQPRNFDFPQEVPTKEKTYPEKEQEPIEKKARIQPPIPKGKTPKTKGSSQPKKKPIPKKTKGKNAKKTK